MSDDRSSGIAASLGRIPSGCSILTAQHGGRTSGMLVSWIQQAAFEPPAVSVCLKRGRPMIELIDASKRFLLNVIDQDPTAMFKHFGRGFSLEEDAFAGLATEPTEFGPLIKACVAQLGCKVMSRTPVGDHDLYLGEVIWGRVAPGAKPYIHLRNSGFSY
jgi:flavin reductase (DIM6/NTAB) family NADH-FMN oxidoreductase RutF